MAAYYKKTPEGESNEFAITQRSLAFMVSLMALLGALFSAGISYGVMRYQIDAKADRTEVRAMIADSMRAADARITRNTETLKDLLRDVADLKGDLVDLKGEVVESKKRTTDIACELVRPRRTYCR